MTKLILRKVEPLAGTDIEEAAAEAVELVARIGISIELVFRDVSIHIWPDSTIEGIINAYYEAVRVKSKFAAA